MNFSQPSGGREFCVLAPGEPCLFKTDYPHNLVVDGRFFSDSARLRVSEAWDLFGAANGVSSVEQMRARIGRYRRNPIGSGEDPVLGPRRRFFPAGTTAEPPPASRPTSFTARAATWQTSPLAPYFQLLLKLLLSAVAELDFRQPGTGQGLCLTTRGWRRTGSGSAASRHSP